MGILLIFIDIEVVDLKKRLLSLVFCLFLIVALYSIFVVSTYAQVGVKEGDWMEYSISYTGNPPEDFASRMRIEVESIQGTNITVCWDRELINGEKWSISETYDLTIGFHDMFIIGAGLELGDEFYHDQFGLVTIGYIEDYEYAGETRSLVAISITEGVVHWDKNTGVLTQGDWNYSPDLQSHWLLEETSLWGQSGLDIVLVVGLIIAVAAALLIVLVFIRRKKKTTEKS